MKSSVFKFLSLFLVMAFAGLYAMTAFSQTVPPATVSPGDFLTQVLAAIQSFGGLSTMLKISAVIMLIVASMKVSYLNTLIWSKLGAAQVYFAPVLGLIAGCLGLGTPGVAVTGATIFAYVSAGGGAVFLHEILDSVKAIPGIGAVYVTVINLIESALGGPAAQSSSSSSGS